MNLKKISNLCFLTLSAALLVVPALLTNVKPDQVSVAENRKLAEPVSISEGLSAYMTGLNSYVNDRIGFRNQMVALYNEFTINVLPPRNDQVIFGSDGWLFFSEELSDYTGLNNNQESVEYAVQVLNALDSWCKENGSRFVFMVGPNKSSVYDCYMPDYVVKSETSFLDALTARLEHENILFVNPQNTLIADRDSGELYMKLDSHWNAYGAEYAIHDLLLQLNITEKTYTFTEERKIAGDLLSMLAVQSTGSDSLYADVDPNPNCEAELLAGSLNRAIRNEDGISFVCYADSFAGALDNYFGHYFNGTIYGHWNVSQTIEDGFPEVFIVQCVERNIMTALEDCNNSMTEINP